MVMKVHHLKGTSVLTREKAKRGHLKGIGGLTREDTLGSLSREEREGLPIRNKHREHQRQIHMLQFPPARPVKQHWLAQGRWSLTRTVAGWLPYLEDWKTVPKAR